VAVPGVRRETCVEAQGVAVPIVGDPEQERSTVIPSLAYSRICPKNRNRGISGKLCLGAVLAAGAGLGACATKRGQHADDSTGPLPTPEEGTMPETTDVVGVERVAQVEAGFPPDVILPKPGHAFISVRFAEQESPFRIEQTSFRLLLSEGNKARCLGAGASWGEALELFDANSLYLGRFPKTRPVVVFEIPVSATSGVLTDGHGRKKLKL